MRWIGLSTEIMVVAMGAVFLLYAYRAPKRLPDADVTYDESQLRLEYKIIGWIIIALGLLALLVNVVGGFLCAFVQEA
jgi:hypothetical protein